MNWSKYDSKKTKKTGAFAKQSVVTKEAVSEVKDDDGKVVRAAQAEEKREFAAYVEKRWDGETGEAQADSKREYSLGQLENEKARFEADEARAKAQVDGLASAIADFKKL
tara:strand:- start:1177 stop:1506 length:330 start_codon:yes stop_codon:yes gene_type:complete